MKYIIDGYNVIHKIDRLKGKRLRSQREGLIRLLEMAQAKSKNLKNLTVVFDGQSNVFAPGMHSTIKIIFTKGKSADKKIKRMVESLSFARDITVVSDDREIRSYISSVGAKKISVKEFLNKIYPTFIEQRNHAFKLDEIEAGRINRELEQIWLTNRKEGK